MFVFDLFEKKKQDAAAGRFVGGTSQDARVKNALDNAYRAVPAAKSPEEAALGYIDIQNSLNQKQDQALAQQNKTNQQQTQQINDLVNDMRRKENDFRNLNAQIASMPNVTPQQAAKMAQDIEAAHSSDKGEPVDVSNVVAKQTAAQPAKTVAAPGPGASVSQLANYQQAKDQGAATAKTQPATPQAAPAPNTSKAIGQMANTIANAPVSKTNTASPTNPNQPAPTQPAQPASNVVDFAAKAQASKADKEAKALAAFGGQKTGTNDLEEQAVPSGAGDAQIAAENEKTIVKAYIGDTDANLTFLSGPPLKLKVNQVQGLVNAFTQIPNGMNKDALKINLFSNRSFLIEWMFENVVNPATATNRPTDVDQNELNQGQLALEGDVVPMTDNQTTNQAYADALIFLKRVYANPNDPMITTMRQDFAHKYQQRFQISQAPAPDRSYYLLDKQLSKKYKLPTPDFKGLEEDSWHNGQNSWSSEHDQWAKESVEQLYSVTTKVVDTDLQVGDPIKVTGPNEFKGKPGRLSEFSPSGRFVIVDLYNHGMHSMDLADIEYDEETAKTDPKDDYWNENAVDETIRKLGSQYRLYSGKGKNLGTFPTRSGAEKHEREVQYFKHAGESVEEGWSDAMVARRTGQPRTPYSVYIKGKKWKDFENDDHAEAVANKLKAKFEAEGRDPSVITIAPTDMSEGVAVGADQSKKVFKDKAGKPVGEIGIDPESSPGNGEWYVHHYATGYSVVGFDSAAEAKRELLYVHKHPDAVEGHPSTKEQGVAEAGSPAQQAAIAVAMKKAGKKPKGVAEDFKTIKGAHGRLDVDTNTPGVTKVSQKDRLGARNFGEPFRPSGGVPGMKTPNTQKGSSLTSVGAYQRNPTGRTNPKLDYSDGDQLAHYSAEGVAEAIPVIRGTQPTGAQYANQLAKIAMKLAKQRHADGLRADAKDFNKAAKLFAAGDIDGGAEIIAYEMDTEPADEFYAYMEHYKIPTEIVFGLNEAQTDFQKRRQRYNDAEAGRPVKPVPKNPQTDYARKRAKDKRDMELGETTNYWTRLQNERNTKIASLVNELKESVEKK
jgi:hypothetical protein